MSVEVCHPEQQEVEAGGSYSHEFDRCKTELGSWSKKSSKNLNYVIIIFVFIKCHYKNDNS